MKEWFTPSELVEAKLPSVPASIQGINTLAARQGWRELRNTAGASLARKRAGRGGGWEYHYTVLPHLAQARLIAQDTAARIAAATDAPAPKGSGDMWDWFARQPAARRTTAEARLAMLDAVIALQRGGLAKNVAICEVARANGVGKSSIYAWFEMVAAIDRADWLPYLAPRHIGRTATVECSPEAWDFVKRQYLTQSGQSWEIAYMWLQQSAKEHGWSIPSSRTLYRRICSEIPKPIFVFLREGEEGLRRLYPAQERDRSMFRAMEAVDTDGHKWDVFVEWPDGTIARPITVAVQDLYSNKILSWRVDRTENVDLVRLAFSDVFRDYGIPDMAYMDNGRAFAAKAISGGTPNRFRFKIRPEDPFGILTSLGIQIHWTLPYSGQSKPIERSWRELADLISRHPLCEGAYTGNSTANKPENYGSRAVPLADFVALVDDGIKMFNARPNRRTRVCGGVKSFDEAFATSYADSLIRKAAPEQLRMCLLAAESVRASSEDGSVRLAGNRYWTEVLHGYMGQSVTVRFDPDDLHSNVHVYRQDGAYIGPAACLEATGFADTTKARDHARQRKAFVRATKEAALLERSMSLDQLAALMPQLDDAPLPETKLIRPVSIGSSALAAAPNETPDTETYLDRYAEIMARQPPGLRLVE